MWIAIGYVAVIAVVVYPAIHEEVGARVLVWNCIPPTLSLLVIATAFHKSRPRMISSMVFALLAAAVTTFFSVIWFFTPLDLDPHSGTTKLVFVFSPIFSLVPGDNRLWHCVVYQEGQVSDCFSARDNSTALTVPNALPAVETRTNSATSEGAS